MFNEQNLWIAVTVRSCTMTKTFLAINLLASPGITHTNNERLHWFEGNRFFLYVCVCKRGYFFPINERFL